MQPSTLRALGGKEIIPAPYILLQITENGEVVIKMITVITRPRFDKSKGTSYFTASCQYVFDRALDENEGAAIELSLFDIGCGRDGPLAGAAARTFTYGCSEYNMLSKAVLKEPDVWKQHLAEKTALVIKYDLQPKSASPFALSPSSSVSSTALSYGFRSRSWVNNVVRHSKCLTIFFSRR